MEDLKRAAAAEALKFVESGMVLGLGSGSTSREFVDLLGAKIASGELVDIVGVPTSVATEKQALELGISLKGMDEVERLDLGIDGADEVDVDLNLIKGLGKALFREKKVESRCEKLIIIVDESKLVSRLGTKGPLPIELKKEGIEESIQWLGTLGCRAEWWMEEDGTPAETDNGNYLAKCWFEDGIMDAYALAVRLESHEGVFAHGLFLDMATSVIVATKDGVKILERK